MRILEILRSGSLHGKKLFRAMSRTPLALTSVASVLILSTTVNAAVLPMDQKCDPSVPCETECVDHDGKSHDDPSCGKNCGHNCSDPQSPVQVWVSPDPDFTFPTFPYFTLPAFPNFTFPTFPDFPIPAFPEFFIPEIPDFTPPEIPVVTRPVLPPEATVPAEPTAPQETTAPEVTTPPAKETDPTKPAEPSTPVEPTSPVEPSTPAEPTAPEETAAPTAPENQGKYPAPVVRVTEEADGVRVSWDVIDAPEFYAYMIVFSETNPNPAYPNDSYYGSITDRDLTSMLVESRYITGGDYYFSVTALYNGKDIAIPGNAVKATMPSTPTPPPQPEGTYPAITLDALSYDGIRMNVSWSKTADTTGLIGYKVVAAIDDTTPTFLENGCAAFVGDADTTSCSYVINGAFLAGKTYSVTVIAVYSANGVEHNISSNVQTIQF